MNYKMENIENKKQFGVGIDVTNINYFLNKSDKFVKRILTKNEYDQFLKTEYDLRPRFLAVRWVLKEATFKAINEFYKVFFTNIEFVKNNNSYVCSTFENVKVSASYENNLVYAIAMYLA